MTVAIHFEPNIEWQAKRAVYFSNGLTALGIKHILTVERDRVADVAILFGTTFWRDIERDGGKWMLVDRASLSDPEYVQLVWNGHGQRGDHMTPDSIDDSRWNKLGIELQPQIIGFDDCGLCDSVICGQTETYSPHWDHIEDWYASIRGATHFRPHPRGDNPTGLPVAFDWHAKFHVLNSSIGIEAVIRGRPVKIHDQGCMAYGILDRQEWANWLAYTQWSWDEIREGKPIKHLFEAI